MDNKWQDYQTLELIPKAAPQPQVGGLAALPLNWGWRWLLNALVREHIYEQRTEYLERCWAIDYAEPYSSSQMDQLRKLLALMN